MFVKGDVVAMTNKEKQLLEKYSSYNFDQLSAEFDVNDFDSSEFTNEFRDAICNMLSHLCFKDEPNIPFEESLQKAYDSWDEERQKDFLTEDWSDFDA